MKEINNLKVSIVMPVYNARKYLHDSINSILKQTLCDFELIVIDDGSTDDSRSIVLGYNDARIKLVENNHDFIGSLNCGIKLSKAPYIARMDADDIMLEKRLEIQYNYMQRHPEIDVCGSWFIKFDDNNELNEQMCHIETDPQKLKHLLLIYNPLVHPATMIRKKSLDSILQRNPNGPYRKEYVYAEDYKLWTELVQIGKSISNVPEVLLKYRHSSNQVVKRHLLEMNLVTRKVQKEYFEYLINNITSSHPECYKLCEELVKLTNDNSLSFESLLSIVSILSTNYD